MGEFKTKNIFENVKFGDKFLTRNGKIAIYHYYNGIIMNQHNLILESGDGICCKQDGSEIGYKESINDIVSKYQKQIDENKLDELADKYTNLYYDDNPEFSDIRENIKAAYINGYYCKAMEE